MCAVKPNRAYNTHRLTEINRALTYARSLDEVLSLTVDCAVELLHAPRALLMLNGEDGLLHIRAARGISDADVARFHEPLDENLLSRLAGLLGPDARERFLGVPLVVAGSVIGLLAVRLESDDTVDEEDEWLLSSLADQASVALEATHKDDVRLQLEDRIGELERTQKGKDRALEILSHDLRTPLSAVVGYTALMTSEVLGPVNDRQQNVLQRMKVVCDHMESILTNVLEMARLTSGGFNVVPQVVSPEEIVRGAVDIVRPSAERAGISLTVSNRTVPRIKTDSPRLRLVLVQLLDNAIKYAPGSSRVIVDLDVVEMPHGRAVQFAVTDEGPGIEKSRQGEIFEPYVRKDGTTDRAKSGVGLGLAIANSIVKRLQGKLTLESEVGHGATFRVLIPIEPSGKPNVAEVNATADTKPSD